MGTRKCKSIPTSMEHPLPAEMHTSHCKREPNNYPPSPSYCLLQHCHAHRCSITSSSAGQDSTDFSPAILFTDTVNLRASCSPDMFGKVKHYWKHTYQIYLQCFAIQYPGGPRVLLTHLRKGIDTKKRKVSHSSLQTPSPERVGHCSKKQEPPVMLCIPKGKSL